MITGAFAERAKFSTFLVFMILWTTIVYDPLAHWVWGVKGWMREMGALDFAGGTVVHISSGASALVAAIMFGRRIGYGQEAMPPHNLPFSVIGAGLSGSAGLVLMPAVRWPPMVWRHPLLSRPMPPPPLLPWPGW